ncbi:hypothetical protein H8K35_15110 [Undibacterium sp. LX40W]|uniref:Uncharacterized protein n=1 Tax=Undibacterium nitidum TaxID=2762298 RepID=A0A923HRM9_9BURK|nr:MULTISPECIES: hypothetical protein [Undibacterium]MBC3882816.1 hypothetical protein [Undibacterium nitidum]MBC3893001.1 hypothetical protein [Undibacterium sp. LX40W]
MRKLSYAMTCLSLMALVGAHNVHASPQSAAASKPANSRSEPPHREPPPQAYEACKAKKKGDVVDIITPRGDKLKGNCTESPKGLFARPEHPPEDKTGDDRRPPPPKK